MWLLAIRGKKEEINNIYTALNSGILKNTHFTNKNMGGELVMERR